MIENHRWLWMGVSRSCRDWTIGDDDCERFAAERIAVREAFARISAARGVTMPETPDQLEGDVAPAVPRLPEP